MKFDEVFRFSSHDNFVAKSALFLAQSIREVVRECGSCSIALAGGRTPAPIYSCLAEFDDIPWHAIQVFWGDERCVPLNHAWSNYAMAMDSLLRHVPILPEHIHPICTDGVIAEDNAYCYTQLLRNMLPVDRKNNIPLFDIVLLGMGSDGHIASLFPSVGGFDENDESVIAVQPPLYVSPAVSRVSISASVINHARIVIFFISGRDKLALMDIVEKDDDVSDVPIMRLSISGQVVLFFYGE